MQSAAYERLCYSIPIDKMAFQMGKEEFRQRVSRHDIKTWEIGEVQRLCHAFQRVTVTKSAGEHGDPLGLSMYPVQTCTVVHAIFQLDVKRKILWFPGEYGWDISTIWCMALPLSFLLIQQLFLSSRILDIYLELQRENKSEEYLRAHKY